MRKKICKLTFLLMLFLVQIAFAQQKSISGQVQDADGNPMPGVSVSVVGTSKGVATDFDGNYAVEAPVGAVLEFSYVGFASQRITVGASSRINVTLKENAEQLDEVVVTGYATQSRKTLATAVSKLDKKTLENVPRANVATALQGSISGLRVTQTTGRPGETPKIQLRGGTAFDGTGSPLILIDGVPGSFYGLNGDDIESMEVLKDAASTAIYGARAANGVILVTTKKGKAGRSSITVRTKYTLNGRRNVGFEYMNAADYIKYNRLAVKAYQSQIDASKFGQFINGEYPAGVGNNPINSTYTTMVLSPDNEYLLKYEGWKTMDDPINPGQKLIYQENNMTELFYQPSSGQDHSVSFEGGNDKGTYYLGLGYLNEKGIVIGTGFNRFSGTFNGSYKIKDNFKVSSNVLYVNSQSTPNYLDKDDYTVFQRAAGMAPTARIYINNPDGSLSGTPHPGVDVSFGNPLYYRDKFVRDNAEQRLTTSIQFDWGFHKDFNLMVRGSHLSINNLFENFDKAYLNKGRLDVVRKAKTEYNRTLRNQITSVLSYKKSFAEKHNVDALLGVEYFWQNYFRSYASTKNSPTDLIYTLNAGSEADGIPFSGRTKYSISSLFGQLNYDYDNRYLLGITFRRDGTSRLAKGNKYDFFPGISLGWNIHNEAFYTSLGEGVQRWVNKIKPRISYGVNGNIDVLGNFDVFGLYEPTSTYDSQTGYVNTKLPNYSLKWERSTTLNIGLDLALLNNRVSLLADFFIRDVTDKISDLSLPLWTGFSAIKTNNGILQNRGFELELNAKVVDNDNFKWNVGTNFTIIRNYAKKLPYNGVENNRQEGQQIYDPATGTLIYVGGLQEGQRVGNDLITAYVFDGVYKTQAEIDADAGRVVTFAQKKTERFLGDTRWKDLNGDNIIDYKDRIVIGRTRPDITGGFNTDFSYKNLSVYVKMDYALGHYAINGSKVKGMAQTQGAQNGPVSIRDSWTEENPNANIPRYVFVDPQKNHRAAGHDNGSLDSSSSLYWEKADYLALREITVSYSLPGSWVNDYFKMLRVYATMGNIAYFTKYSGNSPEEGGIDKGRFPLPRTFTMGLSLTF